MKNLFLFLLYAFFLLMPLSAQSTIIPLWSGPIPGAIQNETYREDTLHPNGNQVRVYRVSKPTLEIFTPLKKNPAKTAVIIAPGGGYYLLAPDIEGTEIAKWLNSLGVTAIVLKYRIPSDSVMVKKEISPLQDAQEAVRYVRRNAGTLDINPEKIGFIGFSAGGHLAGSISTLYHSKVYESDATSARPDFTILGYPVITMDSISTHTGSRNNLLGPGPSPDAIEFFSPEKQVNANTPPAFIFLSEDDNAVPVENSLLYFRALLKNNIPAELHIFQSGGHGFGLGRGGTESGWPVLCAKWLALRGFLQ